MHASFVTIAKRKNNNFACPPLWLKIFLSLFSYEHESIDVSDKNSLRTEKGKSFPHLSDQHRNQTLVDVKARATKSSTNPVVKVLKSTKVCRQTYHRRPKIESNASQKRNHSFQLTKHVSTFSCHLQLQMSFNGCTFEFILRYVTKLRIRTGVQFECEIRIARKIK